MQLKKYWPWLITVLIIGSIFIIKTRTANIQQPPSAQIELTGPAVILFRGDNSASCRAIHRLVDEAEKQYSYKITFLQYDWSADNPLITKLQVRFLPTVILLNQQGKEVGRIIGESPATQARLKEVLTRLDPLLM